MSNSPKSPSQCEMDLLQANLLQKQLQRGLQRLQRGATLRGYDGDSDDSDDIKEPFECAAATLPRRAELNLVKQEVETVDFNG